MNNLVVVDIETKDPHLKDFGCGAIRNDGFIVRLGLFDGTTSMKFSANEIGVGSVAYNILTDPSITKICHNGVYDLDWIQNGYGIPFKGRCEDTMTRAFLINAYAEHYDLDSCALREGVVGKNRENTIQRWWTDHGGKGKAIEHIDEIPIPIVDAYLEQDLRTTWGLFHKQTPVLTNEHLLSANDREVRLYPLLMEMKKNGIRIDWDAKEKLSDEMTLSYEEEIKNIQNEFPFFDSPDAPTQLTKIWKALDIPIQYTEKNNPCFSREAMDLYEHPMADKIIKIRTLGTLLNRFVDGAIPDYSINLRLHSTFFPALRDEGGTVTGRFSSRDPNLQNMPARGDKFGKQIRSLFLPEEGHWLSSFDYRQIEYVLFVHYATGPGSNDARQKVAAGIDYHKMVMDLMGWSGEEGRHLAKNLNFGVIYGLGYKSFAKKFRATIYKAAQRMQMSCEQFARDKMFEYYDKIPFAPITCKSIRETGERRGFVRSIGGRKQRMPSDGRSYKLVNYLIQGSASDVLKEGLVKGWEAGVFDVLKMHVTVHDENVFSTPQNKEGIQAAVAFAECMTGAFNDKLSIPLRIDTEIGPNWGSCSKEKWQEVLQSIGD